MFTIYKITNIINQKIYIGQTSRTIWERFSNHCVYALTYNYNTFFYKAIRKYGKENFIIEPVEENISTKQEADEKEKHYIHKYNSLNHNIGYNSTKGGEGGNTYISKTDDEMNIIRNKISEGLTGEKNGNHRVIFVKDTITNEEYRFGSMLQCEKYLKDNGYTIKSRMYRKQANNNRDFGIQHRFANRYIFRYEDDEYHKWTDYIPGNGTFPYKIENVKTGEIFVGICKNECLKHFGFSGRCDIKKMTKKRI